MKLLERCAWFVAGAALTLAIREATKSAPKDERGSQNPRTPGDDIGPAKGLITSVRALPAHRDVRAGRGRVGFAPVHAEDRGEVNG